MGKKMLSILSVGAIVLLLVVQTSMAYDPNWEETQKKAYKEIGLKPGETINAENWQKVKDCLPPSIVDWVKKGEFVIQTGEFKYDFSHDKAYEEKSMANDGKYAIGDHGQIIEKSTGKAPDYMWGRPFPVIDALNDPQAGVKIMQNNSCDRFRAGSTWTDFDMCWVSDQGLDRVMSGDDIFFYYWTRPDGKPLPNPQGVKRFEITQIKEPFDLAGSAMLYHYWLDGSPERFVQYIPALRRIKKMNVTDRSSPFFGTDFCNDDGGGYVGQPEAMEWKVLEEKILLTPHAEWTLPQPDVMEKLPGGGWKSGPAGKYEYGYEDKFKSEKYNVAWMPWHARWVPRKMYKIEMKPKDPYYAYGNHHLWIDASSLSISYKIIYDKSQQYWKTLTVDCNPAQWGENRSMTMQISYIQVDDKSHHASICNCRGERGKYYFHTYFNIPKNNPRIYKDEYISTLSR